MTRFRVDWGDDSGQQEASVASSLMGSAMNSSMEVTGAAENAPSSTE